MTDKEKVKARVEKLYWEKYLPTYLLFIIWYPFHLEDLEGEIWRWIKGYENLYQISNFGRTKRIYKNGKAKILKPWINRQGYLQVDLCKKGESHHFPVHQLVAEAFISNPENKPEVNHKFGVKFDCYFENLEWSTRAENVQHSYEMGLNHSGENSCKAKLTNEDAKYIREVYVPNDSEFSAGALARKFNVSSSVILDVIHRKSFKNVE